jgi:hypothetical protein
MTALDELRSVVRSLPMGPVMDLHGILVVLSGAWNDLDGAADTSMAGHKVRRIEEASWDPPCLRLVIERHGATVYGSSRAEVQTWSVDVDNGKAKIIHETFRQLRPMAPRLDVAALAREIAGLILGGVSDERVKWSPDHRSVKVNLSAILPPAVKQTADDRRKRFYAALDGELVGYSRSGAAYSEVAERPREERS